MDGEHFDSWTRRSFGIAAGGALATALGLAAFDHAQGNRNERQSRCRRVTRSCVRGNRTQRCCHRLACAHVAGQSGRHCCRRAQAACTADAECCGGRHCAPVAPLGGLHCCANENEPCEVRDDCCGGATIACTGGVCVG